MSRERAPQPGDDWYGVATPRATFAIVVSGGVVVDAAPYARRASIGKPWDAVKAYWLRRGAAIKPIPSTGAARPSGEVCDE